MNSLRLSLLLFAATGLLPFACDAAAQGLPGNGQYAGGMRVGPENMLVHASVEVEVRGIDGQANAGSAYVSLIKSDGKVFATAKAVSGKAHFADVPKSELTAKVIASGYDTATKKFEVLDQNEVKVRIDLRPMADKEAALADRGISALNPKAQKSVGKALESLRANRPANARADLEAAQRQAPNSAEVEYLFGVCASQMNDMPQARTHWTRAIELNPSHLSALLALSQNLLHEHKADEAETYLHRALDIEPSSWRAHMLLAQTYLLNKKNADAASEAQRALDLGHDAAVSAQPLLAHALFEIGEKDRAIQTLQAYTTTHPADENAARLLERLKTPPSATRRSIADSTSVADITEVDADSKLSLPPHWLPPDIDEKVPPVEPGAGCVVDDVVKKAGAQLAVLIHDVDRFTATETLVHESIDKFGIAALPEKRRFNYLVTIQDSSSRMLNVSEYRNGGGAQSEFPDGIVTTGLPALVLIFHPYYSPNYDMVCEGLARTNRGLAWQVHFRQGPDKPNGIKSYRLGMNGPNYQVRLKGRAWISADSYEIIRMESDLVAPIPQIRLLADHTDIEYGPVTFRQGNTTLWLPQSAEVHFAWLGRRIRRRHEFSNYLLFGVDDQQHIDAPKESAGSRVPALEKP